MEKQLIRDCQLTREEVVQGIGIIDDAIWCVLSTLGAEGIERNREMLMETAIKLNDLKNILEGGERVG